MPGFGKSGIVRTSALSGSQSVIEGVINVLPGSFNAKRTERLGFCCVQLMGDHGIDAAATRSFAQRLSEFGERLRVARSKNFHMPVLGVAHPAVQLEGCRFAMHEPAEPN